MKVSELIDALRKCDPDLPVYFRVQHLTGNIIEVDVARTDTYPYIIQDKFLKPEIDAQQPAEDDE